MPKKLSAQIAHFAGLLARSTVDIVPGKGPTAISDPSAITALTRAYRRSIESGFKQVTLPISLAEAKGFPRFQNFFSSANCHYLSVAFGADGEASFSLRSAYGPDPASAHEAAAQSAAKSASRSCRNPGSSKSPGPEDDI